MGERASNRCHNAFANTGDNGFFRGSADESIDIGPYCHPRLGFQLNSVLSHCINGFPSLSGVWAVNNFGIDTGLHSIQDVAPGQINRRSHLPGQVDIGTVSGNQSPHHIRHTPPCQIMAFELRGGEFQSCFACHNPASDNDTRVHFAEGHPNQFQKGNMGTGKPGLKP